MALTKVTGQVIKNTTDVTVGVLTVTNTLAVGGTVSIGGTLTYEDVTNIDSVGLITARNGIVVGSGITLSKDGDGFFTGVVTATSYAGSGANLTGIDTDLVSDTSPQLGGNLDVNTKNIVFGDSGSASDDRLTFGAGTDLSIYHDGTHTYLNNITGNLRIQNNGTVKSAQFEVDQVDFNDSANSAVQVRKEPAGNFKIFKNLSVAGVTTFSGAVKLADGVANGLKVGAGEDLIIQHNGTNTFIDNNTGDLTLQTTGSGTDINIESRDDVFIKVHGSENAIRCIGDGTVELYHDNNKRLATYNEGIEVIGIEGGNASIKLSADEGDDNNDQYRLIAGNGTSIYLQNYASGSWESNIVATGNGSVDLYYDNSLKVQTTSTGMQTVEAVKMTYGGQGVNFKVVYEAGVGNTGTTTATIPTACVGGGTVTITCMHNGNTSITTTKMFPIMFQGNTTTNLGSEIFSINANSNASFNVSAATLGVTVTNNTGNHAKIRVTFDITANA